MTPHVQMFHQVQADITLLNAVAAAKHIAIDLQIYSIYYNANECNQVVPTDMKGTALWDNLEINENAFFPLTNVLHLK